jgi:pimeloyl-ACP methyl ester carboxylesterase
MSYVVRNRLRLTELSRTAILFLTGLMLAGLLVSGKTAAVAGTAELPPFTTADVPPAPNYEDDASWLARPEDPDQFAVDLVWIYPTVLYDESAWLMDITRKDLIAGAQETVATEAHAFSGLANLYAPFYRQMNLSGFNLPKQQRDALAAYGEEDVRKALKYYLDHHNNGRPFIVAAHSQGSYVLTQLALHHWGRIGHEKRMIAAYVIGWSITGDDLKVNPKITICDEPHQTGCFISYNSVAAGHQKDAPMILPGAVVVNPLTWTRDEALAPASLNRGSTFFNKDQSSRTLPHFTSARIADGGLVVTPKDPSLLESPFFPAGVYHSYDYSLFFENIRANAAQRIEAYLSERR